MFCPGCGLEELHSNQFCRACGTDLRLVRSAIEKPDSITASAISARDEIGRAVAAKIWETESATEMKIVAENVLSEIEKFLESPEEKRLRRMRDGTIVAASGLGAVAAFGFFGIFFDKAFLFPAGFGIAAVLIGLGFILNAIFFSVPKKMLSDKSSNAISQRELDADTNDLELPESKDIFSSVTEHTTRQLSKTENARRDEV